MLARAVAAKVVRTANDKEASMSATTGSAGSRAASPSPRRHCFDFDLDQLGAFVSAMRGDPEAGSLTIRASHRWDGGFAIEGRTDVAYGGAEITREHAARTDWPQALGGTDSGPMAGQAGVAAVGACVATTYAAEAAMRGIEIDDLEVTVEGWVDLRGAFELGDAPVGLSGVAITVSVAADVDDAVLDELGDASRRSSPMYQTLANPVPVQLGVRRQE